MNWFKDMMAGPSGEVSSKRTIMFILVFTFVFCVIYNQQTGKNLDAEFKDQLYKLIGLIVILVFGERAIKAWETVRGKVVDKTESSVTKIETTTKASDAS
jgi:hypothetical protein